MVKLLKLLKTDDDVLRETTLDTPEDKKVITRVWCVIGNGTPKTDIFTNAELV